MTEYIVLFSDEDEQWRWLGSFAGRTPRKAIEAATVAWPDDIPLMGQFVAVPARSWKPVTVKVETKTALKFS